MGNYERLIEALKAVIKKNGRQEITGQILQDTLVAIVRSLGGNFQFAGIALPDTNPKKPDQKVFYLAAKAGKYQYFGINVKSDGLAIIFNKNEDSWIVEQLTEDYILSKKAIEELLTGDIKSHNHNSQVEDAIRNALANYITEAPANGKQYVRTDKSWKELVIEKYQLTKAKIEAVLTGDIISHNHKTQMDAALKPYAKQSALDTEVQRNNEQDGKIQQLTNEDSELQKQIDALVSRSDVVDVVASKEQLDNYDTSKITDNDIVKVLRDESRNNEVTYYRWKGMQWEFVGSLGTYYTKEEANSTFATITAIKDMLTKAEAKRIYQPIGKYTNEAPSDGEGYVRKNEQWIPVYEDLDIPFSVSATAIVEIDNRIKELRDLLLNLIGGKVYCNNLLTRGILIDGADLLIVEDSTPSEVPSFAGQIYIDKTGKKAYIAVGNDSVSEWKQITV